MINHARTSSGIFLSGTSIGTLFASALTQNNITWAIGVISGISALVMLYISYKRHIREELESIENKKLLEAQLEYFKKKTKLLDIEENSVNED